MNPRSATPTTVSRLTVMTLLMVAAAVQPASGQDDLLTARAVVDAVAEENQDLRQAELRAALASIAYEDLVGAAAPALSLELDPAYGVVSRRAADFTNLSSVTDFPPSPETSVSHTVGLGLSYRQLLPTGGSLQAGLSGSVTAQTKPDNDDAEPTYAVSPSAGAALSQPLFVDGGLVNLRSRPLQLEAARLAERQARLGVAIQRNGLLRSALELYTGLQSLQRALQLHEAGLVLAQRQLEQVRVNAAEGRASQSDVLAQQVRVNQAQDQMLAVELQIGDLETTLALLMGVESVDSRSFESDLPALAEPAPAALGRTDAGSSPATAERQTDELRLAEARAREELAHKSAGATLSVAVSLTPRYKDERDDPADPATLVTDFQGDGAGMDATVTVGLAVPLTDGGANSRTRTRAEIEREIARTRLASTESRERIRSAYLRARRGVLEERARLLQEELELSEQRIRREQELRELNTSTEGQVDSLRLEAKRIRNQLWQLQVDRYLTDLDLALLAGVDLREAVAR